MLKEFRIWDGEQMRKWDTAIADLHDPCLTIDPFQSGWTIMQRTPWHDCKGQAIFEGDILKIKSARLKDGCLFTMRWIDGGWDFPGDGERLQKVCEVVGNCHQDPQLAQQSI